MAKYFGIDLGTTSAADLSGIAYNNGDTSLWLNIIDKKNGYIIPPLTKIKTVFISQESKIDCKTASGLLTADGSDDIVQGIYYADASNNTANSISFPSNINVKIDNIYWENKKFDLHWLVLRDNDALYGYNSGIYTLPHNIQNNEVLISGNMSGEYMLYRVYWSPIQNEGDAAYTIAARKPYRFGISYANIMAPQDMVPGWTNYSGYASGIMTAGIAFKIPFNDQRNQLPGIYQFRLANVGAWSEEPLYSISDTIVKIDHQVLVSDNKYFNDLSHTAAQITEPAKLQKVDEIEIPAGIINRKRLSIGINDISIQDNTYVKQGIYISSFYPLDFNLYSFSFKTDENIPNYTNMDPYDIVQYFVQFNSNVWEQISPITRQNEYDKAGNIIPKLFIFDKNDTITDYIKYLDYGTNINGFQIKITFNLQSLGDSKFAPPEIYDYKCLCYDKNQFFNQ